MSNLRIETCVIGLVSTDCYLVYHEQTREAVIIDPADNSEYILRICKELKITPKAILLTHGHFDHILAADDLRRQCRCPIYASQAEDVLLRDPSLNGSGSYGTPPTAISADYLLQDNEEIQLIGFSFRSILTPGHTAGSMCYYIASEQVLFSGDTLFLASVGRTDMPTGSEAQIIRSVAEKLLTLPADTIVYPGHDDPTTIAHERQHNPVAKIR